MASDPSPVLVTSRLTDLNAAFAATVGPKIDGYKRELVLSYAAAVQDAYKQGFTDGYAQGVTDAEAA